MTKEEFEREIGGELTPEEWGVIETIYSYHPSILGEGAQGEDVEAIKAQIPRAGNGRR